MGNARRWVIAGATLFGVMATAMAAASVIPPGGPAMPDVLWISGLVKGLDDALQFRVDAPDGVEFAEPQIHSVWGKKDEAPTGVSVRHSLQGWAKTRVHLANCGVVPYAEFAAAGYEATNRTQNIDGVTWREFRKFNDQYSCRSFGWWLEVQRFL